MSMFLITIHMNMGLQLQPTSACDVVCAWAL